MKGFKSAPKCSRCDKSAYFNESITYDHIVYHRNCFKCLNCSTKLTPSAVAKINDDLYCKNCFTKMFREKGSYEVFGGGPSPRGSPRGAGDAPADAAGEEEKAGDKPSGDSLVPPAAAPADRPRSATSSAREGPEADAMAAIRLSSEERARAAVDQHGAAFLLDASGGATLVETAFKDSPDVARVFLACIAARLAELEGGSKPAAAEEEPAAEPEADAAE